MTKPTECPKCQAELPRKGRFCLECGLDLYDEGIHRPPSPWVPLLVVALVVGGVVAVLATRSGAPKLPPEERQVRELTTDLLRLVHDGKHAEIVTRFCEPDTEQFARTTLALREIVRGRGAPGLNVFRATCMNNMEEAKKFVQRYAPEHPEFVVAVLVAVTFQDGALRTSMGGTAFGAQRVELFVAWYLDQTFAGLDASLAEIAGVEWRDGPDGKPLLTATVQYVETPQPLAGLPDPRVLPWRRLGEGKWALAYATDTLLDEVLAFLQRVKL